MTPFNPPAGLFANDTKFLAEGRWYDASLIRFYDGQAQPLGGWELLSSTSLTGVCRAIYQWTDNSSVPNIAFGTHSALEIWQGATLYDITPTLAYPQVTLGANPLTTSNGTPTVTVSQPGHPYSVGDNIIIAGATAVGGITPNGTFTVVSKTTNTWTYTFTLNAGATATGGGSAVVLTPQVAFTAGAIDGTGGPGYGVGTYGTGTYGSPSTGDFFPRTWALSTWGENLIANARNQTIHVWTNNTGTPAKPLTNAPSKVNFALVVPQRQVMAFGCNEETSGIFNPLAIRWSDIEDNTSWTTTSTNNAGEYVLEGGSRIVSAQIIANYVFVQTDVAAYLGQYIGNPGETWRFNKVGDHCGLIGCNASIAFGQTIFWMSPDVQFWKYDLGGACVPVQSTIRDEVEQNLANGQNDKIYACTNAQFREVVWFYADVRDGSGYEISRYVTLNLGNNWCHGQLSRTAYIDAGPSANPIGVTYDGQCYWHEKGTSANGAPLSGYIESAYFYLGEGDTLLQLSEVWPDFKDQVGPVTMYISTALYPQATATQYGPYVFSPGQSKKNFRLTGRVAKVRLEFNSSPAFFRAGKLEFQVQEMAMR